MLEVSLKKAGFNVTAAVNGRDALEQVELAAPDLVIAETVLDEVDGFTFCQRLKANPAWADIPFVFLTAQTDIESKIRGLELGVDDYLTKPIYIKEIVARARILLQKRQRTRIEERRDGRTRFAGRLSDMPVVDLIQTVEISRKSGLITFTGEGGKQAAIYFRDGKVIDAEAGPLQAEDAVYRLLTWNDGEFEVVFRTVRRRDAIMVSSQALLMEGMRRLDEWGRLTEQLPSLDTRFEVDARELAARLGEIPDEHNAILRLFDTRRTVMQVIDASDYGDLECLEVIAKLYFEGLLLELGPGRESPSAEWTVAPTALEETPGQGGAVQVAGDSLGLLASHDLAPAAPAFVASEPSGAVVGAVADEGSGGPTRPVVVAGTEAGTGTGTGTEAGTGTGTEAGTGTGTELGAEPVSPGRIAMLAEAGAPLPPRRKSLVEKAIDESDLVGLGDIDAILGGGPANTLPADAAPGGGDGAPRDGDAAAPAAALAGTAPALAAAAAPAVDGAAAALAGTAPVLVAAAAPPAGVDTSAVPQVVTDDAQSGPVDDGPTPLPPPWVLEDVDDPSGPRVIASRGADTATAAGEVDQTAARADLDATARELVTILPKRQTKEHPIVTPDGLDDPGARALADAGGAPGPAAASAAPAPTAASTASAAATTPPGPASSAAEALGARRPRTLPPPPGKPVTTVAEPGDDEDDLGRPRAAVRWPAVLVGALAVALLAFVIVRASKGGARGRGVDVDAALVATAGDAATAGADAGAGVAIAPDAGVVDAGVVAVAADARPAPLAVDAGAVAVAVDARPAPLAVDAAAPDWRAKLTEARAALDDGDAERALVLADEALALRTSARGLVLRGDALRRLDRVDEALAAADRAIQVTRSYAPGWYLKGSILWSVRRYDEARPVFATYLELQPTGATADNVRQLLGAGP